VNKRELVKVQQQAEDKAFGKELRWTAKMGRDYQFLQERMEQRRKRLWDGVAFRVGFNAGYNARAKEVPQ